MLDTIWCWLFGHVEVKGVELVPPRVDEYQGHVVEYTYCRRCGQDLD